MGREEERLLFPSFAFVIPTESFAEADTTSGSGEYFFIRMVFFKQIRRSILRGWVAQGWEMTAINASVPMLCFLRVCWLAGSRRGAEEGAAAAAPEAEAGGGGRGRPAGEEAAPERRTGAVPGDELPEGAEAGDASQGAARRRGGPGREAGGRLVPEPPRAPQEQAHGGGVRQAPRRARRRRPPELPPRDRGNNQPHGLTTLRVMVPHFLLVVAIAN
jgi:hypothetical protein